RTHDHLDVVATKTPCAAAAIHRGVAAAKHQHALADLLDVSEVDGGQPFDADVDLVGVLVASRNVQIPSARRAAADEDRIEVFVQQLTQRIDAAVADELHAEVEDVPDLFVDHALGQAKTRHL